MNEMRWIVLGALLVANIGVSGAAPPKLDKSDIAAMMTKLSNWGRWGAQDELGTLNLITPAKRRAATDLVKEGATVSLALDLNKRRSPLNQNPFSHELSVGEWGGHETAGDSYAVTYHGFAHSHIDGLSHFAVDGKLYNGYPTSGLKSAGAEKLGIANLKNGIYTRGILVDVPLLKGVPYVEPGTPILIEDLEAWEKRANVTVGSGDVLLVRTGRWVKHRQSGEWDFVARAAGMHASVASWLKERDVAVIGCDGVSDVMPSGVEGLANPLHQIVLVAMGMHILDNLDLEALAQAAAERQRWEFLTIVAPLRVPGGTGSPVNPLAVF